MSFDIKSIIQVIAIGALIGFFFGWLNPIEGPYDYLYDRYASQPAHKHPAEYAPLKPYQLVIDVNDLSEEDFEALQAIFVNK